MLIQMTAEQLQHFTAIHCEQQHFSALY